MTSEEENTDTNDSIEVTFTTGQELAPIPEQENSVPSDQHLPESSLQPPPVNESNVPQDQENVVSSQGDMLDTSKQCPICMEDWTLSTEHRVCCLKCGHLFGRSCIERWIKEKAPAAYCPACNKPTKKVDVRDLWCKSIKALDSTDLTELKRALDKEKKERKTDKAIIFQQNLKMDVLYQEIGKLKKALIERDDKVTKYRSIINSMNDAINQRRAQSDAGCILSDIKDLSDFQNPFLEGDKEIPIEIDVQPRELKGKFHFAERVESSSTGGCRSFALCPTSSIILIAQPTPTGSHAAQVFGAYGLRKYSTLDTNVREFIPLHNKVITSIQLKPIGDLILTSGQDKRVRLTSINNNICVQSYQTQHEPTSVAWCQHRDHQFYVGSGNCFVTLYDIRNTSEYIYQTSQRVAGTRLLSMASITKGNDCQLDSGSQPDGLLVSDSKGCQFMEISQASDYDSETIDRGVEHLSGHTMPFDGLMGTVDFYKPSGLSLISQRRSPHSPNSTHNLVRFKQVQPDGEDETKRIECERVKTFFSNRSTELLSQSRILSHPTLKDHVLVGSGENSGVRLWDSSDQTEYQTIKTDTFVRDMIMYTPENTNQHILYTLSEKSMNIYRWDYA